MSTTNSLIEAFLDNKLYGENVSKNTIEGYRKDMILFFYFIKYKSFPDDPEKIWEVIYSADLSTISIEDIKKVTLDDITKFLKALTLVFYNSTTTKNRRLACLKSFYKFCFNYYKVENILLTVPMLKTTKNKLPKYLSEEEADKLLNAVKQDCNYYRNRLILSIVLNAGLRVEEVHNLTTDNIVGDELVFIGKGDKERVIPMNQDLMQDYQAFIEHRKSNDKLLFNIEIRSIQRMVKSLTKAIGRPEISIHGLRHTFATRLLKRGIDPETIRELMGHSDIGSTQVYFHTDTTAKHKAVSALSAL